jgi:hypothetical protein
MKELYKKLANWSDKQFGLPSQRDSKGPLNHLKEEINEALDKPKDILEWADMLLLVLDGYRRENIGTLEDLEMAANTKVIICQNRKWGQMDSNGVVKHID